MGLLVWFRSSLALPVVVCIILDVRTMILVCLVLEGGEQLGHHVHACSSCRMTRTMYRLDECGKLCGC